MDLLGGADRLLEDETLTLALIPANMGYTQLPATSYDSLETVFSSDFDCTGIAAT